MRNIVAIAATVLAACAASAPAVKIPANATPAPELLLSRVQVALGALGRIEREWPASRTEDACVLVFDETTQWLLRCPSAPTDDFAPTGQTFLGTPVFSGPSAYEKMKMIVGTVRPLKLADAKTGVETTRPVFLMQALEALGKHHPAFDANTTTDEWLAIFVHEYFHGYQLFHPTVREYLSTWTAAQSRDNLPALYKKDPAYQEAVKKEFAGLHAAVAAKPDEAAAKAALKAWRALYAARLERFGPALEAEKPGSALAKVDGFVTFLEGVARYVETRFLVEASLREGLELKGDPRFHGFADFTGRAVTDVPGRGTVGSEYFYAIGMDVSFLLDAARPSWKQTVLASPRLLVGEVDDAIATP